MLPNQEEKMDPRVKRTRNLLETAFMELLAEKGFRAVSVQDITARAEINRATFYAHFPDKYGLLDHVIRQTFRGKIQRRSLDLCSYSLENLHALIVTVCEFVAESSSHCIPRQPQFESLVESQIKNELQLLLRHWIEEDTNASNRETAATAAGWATYGLAQQWSRDKTRGSAEAFADEVLPLVAANLRLTQPPLVEI